ncbi:MAG: hypothetical protein HC900_00085 [Methylacidiphilales bacterium]|nr:hypothetical protein [Candidatus Methylacidiphilales bacterium]
MYEAEARAGAVSIVSVHPDPAGGRADRTTVLTVSPEEADALCIALARASSRARAQSVEALRSSLAIAEQRVAEATAERDHLASHLAKAEGVELT